MQRGSVTFRPEDRVIQAYPGIWPAWCENILDPLGLYRVQVRIPNIHGPGLDDLNEYLTRTGKQLGGQFIPAFSLPWAWPCFPKGFFGLPSIGDRLWVMLQGDDPNYPVYLGCWPGTVISPEDSPLPAAISTTDFDAMFEFASGTCPGLDWRMIKAVAISESSLNPAAIGPGGYAVGIMQINTKVHTLYSRGDLITNVPLNIEVGTSILCNDLTLYGNISDAIAHYKGWNGYNDPNPLARAEVNRVLAIYQSLIKGTP